MIYFLSIEYAAFALAHVLIICCLTAKMRFSLLGRITRRHLALAAVVGAVGFFEVCRALGFFFFGPGGTGYIYWDPVFVRIFALSFFRTAVTSVISFWIILLVLHVQGRFASEPLKQGVVRFLIPTAMAFAYYLGRKVMQRYLFGYLGAMNLPISGYLLVITIDYLMPLVEISALLAVRWILREKRLTC